MYFFGYFKGSCIDIDDKNKDIINSQIKDSKYKNVGFYGPLTGRMIFLSVVKNITCIV